MGVSKGNNLRHETRDGKMNESSRSRCDKRQEGRAPDAAGGEHRGAGERSARVSATREEVGCVAAAHDARGENRRGVMSTTCGRTTRVTELEREHTMEADMNDRTAAALSWRVEPPTIELR